MTDESIIELFWKRNEQAIDEVSDKYGNLCYQLANNIVKNKEDAEECVSDTYLSVWNSIPEERPQYLKAFICRITKNLALNLVRYNGAKKRGGEMNIDLNYDELSECISGIDTPEEQLVMKELSNDISYFLTEQSKTNRQIFIRRYWFLDSIDEISKMVNMNTRSIATILFRMRKKLKKYLIEKGYKI